MRLSFGKQSKHSLIHSYLQYVKSELTDNHDLKIKYLLKERKILLKLLSEDSIAVLKNTQNLYNEYKSIGEIEKSIKYMERIAYFNSTKTSLPL